MNALRSFFHSAFVVSGILFVICTCLLFSNVCSREKWEIVYISDQLKNCEKHGGFSWVPNTLVCAAAAQMTSILFNWQVHRAEERHMAFTLHGLVFHFVCSLSSVVREIGVYWYLFSNHYSLRCIYVERKQRKRAQLLLGVLELYKSSLLLAFSCFAR